MNVKQFEIRITGKVQGVWFRKSTKEVADRLGLRGLIKNELDGSVIITVQGEKDALVDFLSYCKEGPEKAKVDNIFSKEDNKLNDFTAFAIERD